MKNRIWVELREILSMHADQIAEHGGLYGVRDRESLDSALSQPKKLSAYGNPSLFTLAAAFAVAIARNRPFVDGNERSAFMASASFLAANGWELQAPETDAVIVFQDLAAGRVDESGLAVWFERHSKRDSSRRIE